MAEVDFAYHKFAWKSRGRWSCGKSSWPPKKGRLGLFVWLQIHLQNCFVSIKFKLFTSQKSSFGLQAVRLVQWVQPLQLGGPTSSLLAQLLEL